MDQLALESVRLGAGHAAPEPGRAVRKNPLLRHSGHQRAQPGWQGRARVQRIPTAVRNHREEDKGLCAQQDCVLETVV